MSNVRMNLAPYCGRGSTVEVDGHDITSAIRSTAIYAEVGRLVRLDLELVVGETFAVEGEMRVMIPAATREALIALGWTAPEDAAKATQIAAEPSGATE